MYRRAVKTIAALMLGTGQEALFQLLAAAIWIRAWGAPLYSEWLLLSLLPLMLLRGGAGVYHAAASELIAAAETRDNARARDTYDALRRAQHGFLAAVAGVYVVLTAILVTGGYTRFFSPSDCVVIAALFALQFALFQSQQALLALVKADGRAPVAVMWQNGFRLVFIAVMLTVAAAFGPLAGLAVGVSLQAVHTAACRWRFRDLVARYQAMPASSSTIAAGPLFMHGLRFSALGLGQTGLHTAAVYALGALGTPLLGAAYHNLRTISRLIVLVARVVEQAARLELSAVFAAGDTERASAMHRHARWIVSAVAIVGAAAVIAVGEPVFRAMTDAALDFDLTTLTLLTLGAAVYAVSQVDLAVLFSVNAHRALTTQYAGLTLVTLCIMPFGALLGVAAVATIALLQELSLMVLTRAHARRTFAQHTVAGHAF